MVYTVTFNPSLDYIVTVDDFRLGLTNRTTTELMLPGGKGLNVSTVLSNLGIENSAIYFSAGFVGDEITRKIKETGIMAEEIKIEKGCSRINLKLKSVEGTEINGNGPEITESDVKELYIKLDKLKEGDVLVLAGSIPSTLPETIYSDIMEYLQGRGIRIVVDATKELLMNVLKYRPFLIKPNNQELGELFGVTLETRESVVPYAEKLLEMGAKNVIVSMAGDGAVFVTYKNPDGLIEKSFDKESDILVYMREAPEGQLVNGVGAGDSMVAGFIAGILMGIPEEDDTEDELLYAFKMGLSAGSASAYSEYLATREEIERLYKDMQ